MPLNPPEINPRIAEAHKKLMRETGLLRLLTADWQSALFYVFSASGCAYMAFTTTSHRNSVMLAAVSGALLGLWLFSVGVAGRIVEAAGRVVFREH